MKGIREHRISQLYVITGSSGGGKSTLLEELARRGYSVVPEAGRQLVREQQSIGGVETGSDLFGQLLFSRSMYLYNQAVESLGSGPINADLLQKTVPLLPNRGSQQE